MAEEMDDTTGEGRSEGKTAKSPASEGFTFTDWLEGAVILVMVGALIYKFVG
ncbi:MULTISPECIES: hypothetical protein [unclassified Streptomyces]|uniref:hypothetical protein n=1 Tax=unclassified Streptomyces TaxID=2593676 RepID=UPI0033D0B792